MHEKEGLRARDWGIYVYCVLSAVFLTAIVFMLVSCSQNNSTTPPPQKSTDESAEFKLKASDDELIVTTYNLLNLFDTQYDVGKKDYTFLPSGTEIPGTGKKKEAFCEEISSNYYKKQCLETNWTKDYLALKLSQIKKALDGMGDLPDILGVQEIENENVARQLAEVLGYKTNFYITNSPDKRGIDVALFYKSDKLTQVGEAFEIVMQGPEFPPSFVTKPTRNVLRMEFDIKGAPGATLGVYVNHWPSQAAGPDKRIACANKVKKDIEAQTAKYGKDNYYVMLIGDFNVLLREIPNAFNNVMQDPNWNLALADAQDLSTKANRKFNRRMPPGTFFYWGDKVWNKLDRILVSQNFIDKKGVELLPKTFRIGVNSYLFKTFPVDEPESFFNGSLFSKVPTGYKYTTLSASEAGYSDHLPVAVKVKLK